MKKNILLTILLSFILVGCGNNGSVEINASIKNNTTTFTNKDFSPNDSKYSQSSSDEAFEEDVYLTLCGKSDKWNSESLSNRYVQIGDIILYPGLKTPELLDIINMSKYNYDYEYNEGRIVESHETYDLEFFYNGTSSFTCKLLNPYDDMISLSDTVLVLCEITPTTYDSCWLLNGISLADIYNFSYPDVKDLSNTIFDGYNMDETSTTKDGMDAIKIIYYQEPFNIPNTSWTEKRLIASYKYEFYIDKDTGVVGLYSEEAHYRDNIIDYHGNITSLSVLSGEQIEDLKKATYAYWLHIQDSDSPNISCNVTALKAVDYHGIVVCFQATDAYSNQDYYEISFPAYFTGTGEFVLSNEPLDIFFSFDTYNDIMELQ